MTIRLALAALLLLVAACSGTGGAPIVVDGREFLSTAVTDKGIERPLVTGTRIRIGFKDARLTASAGCNTMSGAYRIDAGRLIVDQLATTEMGCDQPRMDQDQWLATFLGAKPNVRLADTTLALDGATTSIALLDRTITEPDLPLLGTTWTVESVFQGDTVSNLNVERPATLVFSADGRVQLFTGCNTGAASVAIDTAKLTMRFSEIVTTKRACQDNAGEVEQSVLTALRSEILSYRIQSSILEIRAGSGTPGLQLRGSASQP